MYVDNVSISVLLQGQVEEAMKIMHFDKLSIFRPA